VVATGHDRSDLERTASALREQQNRQQEQLPASSTIRTTERFTTKMRSVVSGGLPGTKR
jgi:hypothetical protein